MVSFDATPHYSHSHFARGTAPQVRSLSELESPIKIRSSGFPKLHPSIKERPGQGRVGLEIEWFTEAEIEALLSALLVSYRAFYLEPDESSSERHGDARKARIARQSLKAIFGDRLSAQDEVVLLWDEEEDVMNLFMTYVREMEIPSTAQTETFLDVPSCLDRIIQLGDVPNLSGMDASWQFVRKIT